MDPLQPGNGRKEKRDEEEVGCLMERLRRRRRGTSLLITGVRGSPLKMVERVQISHEAEKRECALKK